MRIAETLASYLHVFFVTKIVCLQFSSFDVELDLFWISEPN